MNGRCLSAFLVVCLGLAACTATPHPPAEPGKVLAFECTPKAEFIVDIGEDRAWLFLPGQTISLPRVRQVRELHFSDGAINLWSKGDSALLDLPGARTFDCQADPRRSAWESAKLHGRDFRAVGNQPDWVLEMDREWIDLKTGYAARRFRFPVSAPENDPAQRRSRYHTQAEGHELLLDLETRECHDSLSGESFETRVRMVLDGQIFHGCGRALH